MSIPSPEKVLSRKRELMQALLFEAGVALFDCQGFEYSLAYLLFHLSRLGVPGLSHDWTMSVLDYEAKATAGQLLEMIRTHSVISPNLQHTLEEALQARNYLVHRVLMENIEQIVTQKGREGLKHKITSLRKKVQNGERALNPYIRGFAKALDGIDLSAIQAEATATFFSRPPAP